MKILKTAREKHFTYRETKIRIALDFSSETIHARREWSEIFKILGGGGAHLPRILSSKKILQSEGKIKIFIRQTKIEGIFFSKLVL